jgi:hypothetical protein
MFAAMRLLVMGLAIMVAELLQHGNGLDDPGLGLAGLSWDWCASMGALRACGSDQTQLGCVCLRRRPIDYRLWRWR